MYRSVRPSYNGKCYFSFKQFKNAFHSPDYKQTVITLNKKVRYWFSIVTKNKITKIFLKYLLIINQKACVYLTFVLVPKTYVLISFT